MNAIRENLLKLFTSNDYMEISTKANIPDMNRNVSMQSVCNVMDRFMYILGKVYLSDEDWDNIDSVIQNKIFKDDSNNQSNKSNEIIW